MNTEEKVTLVRKQVESIDVLLSPIETKEVIQEEKTEKERL